MVLIITIEIVLWSRRHSTSLEIFSTSLKSLELDSLQEIRSGHVSVRYNSQLCYANDIDWSRLIRSPYQFDVSHNRDSDSCGK